MISESINVRPQRLHPLLIIFKLFSETKNFIIPATIFFFVNLNSDSIWMLLANWGIFLYFLYMVVSTILGWWHFTYVFFEKELRLVEGRFVKSRRYIPLERIQSVQLNTHYMYRLFGLTAVILDIASTSEDSSVKLALVKKKEADRIKALLDDYEENIEQVEEDQEKSKFESTYRVRYSVTLKEIMVAAFTSFQLFAIVPILFGLFSMAEDVIEVEDYLDVVFRVLDQSLMLSILAIIALLALSISIGTAITFVTYGGFKVSTRDESILIEKGILSQTEKVIPMQKIQAIKINEGLLRRVLGLVEIELVCAGSVDDLEMESIIMFPFIKKQRSLELIKKVVPHIKIEETMQAVPKHALIAKYLRINYFVVIVCAVNLYFWPNWWPVSVVIIILSQIRKLLLYWNSLYLRNDRFIQLSSGSISKETQVVSKTKIQELTYSQSLIQRKLGLGTLIVATKGNPVNNAEIRDIPIEEAEEFYQWYAMGKISR